MSGANCLYLDKKIVCQVACACAVAGSPVAGAFRNSAAATDFRQRWSVRPAAAFYEVVGMKLEPLLRKRAKEKQRDSGGAVPQKSAEPGQLAAGGF